MKNDQTLSRLIAEISLADSEADRLTDVRFGDKTEGHDYEEGYARGYHHGLEKAKEFLETENKTNEQ